MGVDFLLQAARISPWPIGSAGVIARPPFFGDETGPVWSGKKRVPMPNPTPNPMPNLMADPMSRLTTPALLLERTACARAEAQMLLESLRIAKEHSEARLAALHMADSIKRVTGQSSLDRAIASTRHMIDTLDRNHQQIEREFGSDPSASVLSGRVVGGDGGDAVVCLRASTPLGA